MQNQPITVERIEELLQFLPLFEQPDCKFIQIWEGGDRQSDGSITLPYPRYTPEVEAFFRLAGQPWWCDYQYNPAEASMMLQDDEQISTANFAQLQTMLTYCVRGERFCDGFWGSLLESGRIVLLLKRLAAIKAAM